MDGVWNRLDCAHDAIIEASAGTGKTFAIENIVLRLVCEEGYSAPQILVVTFTEKAAGELKNRVRKALSAAGHLAPDFDEMTICTIHSFCKRLLDEYAFECAMPMRSDICASAAELHGRAAQAAVRDVAFAAAFAPALMAASPDEAPPISRIMAAALDGFDEKAERAEAENPDMEDVTRLRSMMHEHCDALKAERGVVTYNDLITLAAEIVGGAAAVAAAGDSPDAKSKARFLDSIRRHWRVALVDEFQDTDARQWELFRTLFSHRNNPPVDGKNGFLLVVGDPKQAIYSFRDADVAVYCRARDAIVAEQPPYTLDATYRSTRSLVAAFNAFFATGGKDGWFANGAGGAGIVCPEVLYPANNPKFANLRAEDEIAPVVLLESVPGAIQPGGPSSGTVHFGNKAMCLPCFLGNAAREMKRLRAFCGGTPEHPLRFTYGDMCVLVATNTDASQVRGVLAAHGIPYAQYKQRGVFASAEAEGVIALLDFLAWPEGPGRREALLLSPVFGVHPSRLATLGEDFNKGFDEFAAALVECAQRRDWINLFERVMNDPATALSSPGGDICAFNRTRSAMRQIFDALLADDSTRHACDAVELAETLRVWRENDATAQENGSLYEKESAADRVQIITMHSSKGLQFPIVFLATGFSKVAKEDAEERRRLVYVAITRAEHRIYIPWSSRAWNWTAEPKKGKPVMGYGIGSKGAPLAAGGFLADAIRRAKTLGIFRDDGVAQIRAAADDGETAATPPPVPASRSGGDIPLISFPPDLRSRRLRWESFSSLHAKSASAATPQVESPSAAAPLPATSLLPRGIATGNTFHEIMETLCKADESKGEVGFANAHLAQCETALRDIIRRAMRRNALVNSENDGDSTELTLLRMVRRTLAASIRVGGETFVLRDIARRDRLAEVDFVLSDADMFLNGRIDLVIRKGSRVFIIDWKTNTLADYSDESIAAAMEEAGYTLQREIYEKAAAAWLRPSGLVLSGTTFLFVRMML